MTKKQLKNYITKIRPKAYAYDRICEILGIKNNILGYIQELKVSRVDEPVKPTNGEQKIVNVRRHSNTKTGENVEMFVGENDTIVLIDWKRNTIKIRN